MENIYIRMDLKTSDRININKAFTNNTPLIISIGDNKVSTEIVEMSFSASYEGSLEVSLVLTIL